MNTTPFRRITLLPIIELSTEPFIDEDQWNQEEEDEDYFGLDNDLGITKEDYEEFVARNEERGTAFGHWY